MKRILLAATASVLTIATALAADSAPMPGMDMKPGMGMKMMAPSPSDSASTKDYKAAMAKMMDGMPMMKFTGDADKDFMSHMRAHHQGAINMAKIVLANGKDPGVKKLAQDIVTAQEKEIIVIDTWIKSNPQ